MHDKENEMNVYGVISKMYDMLDVLYFNESGKNPRKVIMDMIPDKEIKLLDMCCGTLSNTLNIAKGKSDIKVLGLDLSEDMLKVAEKKVYRQQVRNVSLKCGNAAKTEMESASFDYIIIGLVLHESSPELTKDILQEARRLLKQDGRLIVLEWEPTRKLKQTIKFFPLYIAECMCSKTFRQFYIADKELYFKNNGFEIEQKEYCNYTIVLNMTKTR